MMDWKTFLSRYNPMPEDMLDKPLDFCCGCDEAGFRSCLKLVDKFGFERVAEAYLKYLERVED